MGKRATLTYGNPAEVADVLDGEETDTDQLRAALINAMRRIARLEEIVSRLDPGSPL